MKADSKPKIFKVLVWVGFFSILFFGGDALAKTQLQMTLGGLSGSYYMIGSPVAKFVNENSQKIQITPVVGGGLENVRRVNAGVAEIGMTSPVELYKGWYGIDPFKEKARNWRVVGISTRPMGNHVVTLAKYNIKTLEDVKGHIFSIGAAGSGATAAMFDFLQYTGLDKGIKIRKLPHKDSHAMLLDGKIHVFNRLGSAPISSVEEVAAQQKIAIVDLGPLMDKSGWLDKYPYYMKYRIKPGTYKNVDYEASTFGSAGYFIIGKDVPDDIVYEFTRLAYSDGCIKAVSMATKGHNLNREDPLLGNIGPVHPGAEKFWKEIGLTIPEPKLN